MNNLWNPAEAGASEIDQLVYLSRLIGSDPALMQPGGGNTSVKLEEEDVFGAGVQTLVVKGSGTDLRTISAGGFTHLYLDRLAALRGRESMTDEEMMALMRACMLGTARDPLPSVETPLHSLLPARFVAHTHDVATLSLSDTPRAAEHVERAFGKRVAFLEYVRPGFPLARRLSQRYAGGPPPEAVALVMEKHGLAAWGETARECYENLAAVITKAEEYVAERAKGRRAFGAPVAPALGEQQRRQIAAAVMPAVRGELARLGWRCVLALDDSPEAVEAVSGERFPEVAARGVMTPEHILRCGRRATVLNADAVGAHHDASLRPDAGDTVREAIHVAHERYLEYAKAHGVPDPIPDWLKVIAVPGVGLITAGKDRRNALIAADCYRATLQAMAGADVVEEFQSLSEADACEMEYWPLERRKVEERERSRRDLDGRIAVVIGAASGIGRAAALRLAQAGAHVVAADLDLHRAQSLADEINAGMPERAHAVAVNVSDPEAVTHLFRDAVLHFGGVDVLFYSPGVAPELHSVADMPEAEIEVQMQVHFRGAVAATREASRLMLTQGTDGRLVYNASKAAYAPGVGAAAYGASKAALVHYVRNVAAELGQHGITANYINADAVDTPLFRSLLQQRAAAEGKTEAQMLEHYRQRAAVRYGDAALVPPEAVAEAVAWLVSDRAAYTTGCVITVGGGSEGFPR